MRLYDFAIAGAGVALGLLFSLVWHYFSRRLVADKFWSNFAAAARELVTGEDPDKFFAQYSTLLKSLVVYAAKKMGVLVLAIAPIAVLMTFFGTLVFEDWNRATDAVCVHPGGNWSLSVAGSGVPLTGEIARLSAPAELQQPAQLQTPADNFDLATLLARHAFTSSKLNHVLLDSLGFEVTTFAKGSDVPTIIVRPYRDDDNFCWPYLNDLEFLFFVALSVASMLMLVLFKVAKR